MSESAPRLTHQPALDGLRGLAVAAVFLFHLTRLDGGFLGVDLFFVLSGFLITSLLVTEQVQRGRIDLVRFWVRRARRLLPALFLLLGGVALFLLRFTPDGQRPLFRDDALATLGYVANWQRMLADIGYWESYAQKSPLEHTWSLAIEEQFYLVWPIVALLALRWAAKSDRVRLFGYGALAVAGVSFALLAVTYDPIDTNRAYFSTDTRLGPTLLGAALALLVGGAAARSTGNGNGTNGNGIESRTGGAGSGTTSPEGTGTDDGNGNGAESGTVGGARRGRWLAGLGSDGTARADRWLVAAAAAGAVWMLWSVVFMDGSASWYYRGGQLTFALAAVVVIRAVTSGRGGLVGRVAELGPLRALGAISYGVYLWHWPLIIYLTPERLNVERLWLVDLIRVVATLALATASYVLVEQPIRRGAWKGLRIQLATVGAVAATLAVVLFATDGTAVSDAPQDLSYGPIPTGGSDNPSLLYPTDVPDGATKLLMVGDSGVHTTGPFVKQEGERRGDFAVASSSPLMCTVVDPEGVVRFPDGEIMPRGGFCQEERRGILRDLVETYDPDVVVYYLANAGGAGEVRIDGEWVLDCDELFDDYLTDALGKDVELLGSGGAKVVLTTTPHNNQMLADGDEKVECRNETYERIVDRHPGTELLDLDTFVWDRVRQDDVTMFKDVVHLSDEGSRLVAAWLLEELTGLL